MRDRIDMCIVLLLETFAVTAMIAIGGWNVQAQSSQAITRPVDTPKWEAVSIKSCAPGNVGRGSGGGRGAGPGTNASPDRLTLPCLTVSMLVNQAFVTFVGGNTNLRQPVRVEGGPAWINSDLYQISAKSDVRTTQEMMKGPMLQVLLEDRFGLKIERKTKEVPAYTLTVSKGGAKLRQGTCIVLDPTNPPAPLGPKKEPPHLCGADLNRLKTNGDRTEDLFGATLGEFSALLSRLVSRPVLDGTGIKGNFDFHLEYAPEHDTYPPGFVRSDEPAGPSIFTALQEQLGLKLESAQGLLKCSLWIPSAGHRRIDMSYANRVGSVVFALGLASFAIAQAQSSLDAISIKPNSPTQVVFFSPDLIPNYLYSTANRLLVKSGP
jgi:uncharacterized protein (TIGR03435 family)